MPRRARIDAPGALHHIIIRSIERQAIFRNTADREDFLKRLGDILAVRKSMISCADVARTLRISPATVSRATSRGVAITNMKQLQDKLLISTSKEQGKIS